MAKALVREPIVLEEAQEKLDELYTFDDLAQAAAETLGYRELLTSLPKLRKEVERQVSFKRALVELDVQPFNPKAVERYKKKMARRTAPLKTRVVETMLGLLASFFLLAGAASILGLIAGTACGISTALTAPSWLMGATAASIGTAVVCFLAIGAIVQLLEGKKFTYAEWVVIPIREYSKPIPEFALQTAVDLKKKCPEARFFIEELQLKQRTFDPFLVAEDAEGNTYFLEVWNEPKFSVQR